jgi:hypothetical protein
MRRISIIIPGFNEEYSLETCLKVRAYCMAWILKREHLVHSLRQDGGSGQVTVEPPGTDGSGPNFHCVLYCHANSVDHLFGHHFFRIAVLLSLYRFR